MNHEERTISHVVIPLLLPLVFSACVVIPKFQARGRLAGQEISTTTDSALSKYYLEHYINNDRSNPDYNSKIDRAMKMWNGRPLNSDNLRELTQHFSPDFATLYFVSRIYQDPRNRRAQQAFHSHLAAMRNKGRAEMSRIAEGFTSYLIAFVPGYAYKRNPATGADFARQRRVMNRAGFNTLLIETDEIGTVEENASILAGEVTRLGKKYEKVILVSSSKGGPEVALAIGKLMMPDQLRNVKAWISIGGLLRGSPSADQALKWPRSWLVRMAFFFKGLRAKVIENLTTKKRKAVFAGLTFPSHIVTLQYVGVPLSGQIGEYVEGRYKDLREFGPNDGLTLLADELVPGGIVITDLSLDHYYLDPEIDLKTFALTHVILDELERRKREGSSSGGNQRDDHMVGRAGISGRDVL